MLAQNYSLWLVEIVGSSSSTRSRIGIKIQSIDGKNYEHSFRFLFPTSNNIVDYEATIHGLKMLWGMKGERVMLHTDSQLVAHQAIDNFKANHK